MLSWCTLLFVGTVPPVAANNFFSVSKVLKCEKKQLTALVPDFSSFVRLELMSMAKPQKAFATRQPGEAVPWELGGCWRSRRMKKFIFLSFCNKVKSY